MDCFVDYRITDEELNTLISMSLNPIKIPECDFVYQSINGHADIQVNIVDRKNRTIMVNRDVPDYFLNILKERNINYILSQKTLGKKYPENVILNGLVLDDYFIHNLKFTDPVFLESQSGKKFINVRQGYTKCSVAPINQKAIITSDRKICEVLTKEDFDVLLVPYGDIILPPFEYGFIGGACGMVSDSVMAFFGNIHEYKYSEMILDFLKKHKVTAVSLKKGKLVDRGSLICL